MKHNFFPFDRKYAYFFVLFKMAALRSPFYGENLNLLSLRIKILALDYAPLPANIFSHEVCIFL